MTADTYESKIESGLMILAYHHPYVSYATISSCMVMYAMTAMTHAVMRASLLLGLKMTDQGRRPRKSLQDFIRTTNISEYVNKLVSGSVLYR